MIRFSRSEDYAIILIHTLAQNYKKRFVPLSEIAKTQKISVLFLRNLANQLRNAGIITAVEGKNGGYTLVRSPYKIKIGDILDVFSPKALLPCCPIGHKDGSCVRTSFCQTGTVWRKLNEDFLKKISGMTLDEFIHYKTQ